MGPTWAKKGPGQTTPKMTVNIFMKWHKEIISFQIIFNSLNIMSYEWFSCLNENSQNSLLFHRTIWRCSSLYLQLKIYCTKWWWFDIIQLHQMLKNQKRNWKNFPRKNWINLHYFKENESILKNAWIDRVNLMKHHYQIKIVFIVT